MLTRTCAWACTLALLAVCPGAQAQATKRPNIVVILVDDLRFDALGCTGHPFAKTPNIDRLAREGAVCQNAFVTTPLCSPSRASFLTGRYVHAHGVLDNGNHNALSHQLVTFPALLHGAGYQTAYVGKWHMGNDDSPRPGFDRWVSFKGQGRYEDPELNFDGKSQVVEGYITDLLNDQAVEFLKTARDRPFALYLAHKAVHGPFTPAERHRTLYADEPVARPASADDTLEGKPALTRPLPAPAKKAAANKKAAAQKKDAQVKAPARPGELARQQLRCLAAIDEGVGKILQTLESTGHLDDTFVVFTSDNGYFWGEHGLGDKRAAYEESIRIPMLVRYPKLVKAGTKIEQPVLNIDLAPTALALAGEPARAEMKGRSLLPLFENGGKTADWRTSFLAEYFAEPQYGRIPTWQAIRSEKWKLIHYPDLKEMDELYDLAADPHEMKNRIGDADALEALQQLKHELAKAIEATK